MPPGPLLALDVGTRTIGLARTDPTRTFVFVDPTLERRSVRRDVEALVPYAKKHGVVALVVGIATPERPGDPPPRSARLARQVGEALSAALGTPVHWVDEAYTTLEAHERLRAAPPASSSAPIDGHAAAVFLEDFLVAAEHAGEPTPTR